MLVGTYCFGIPQIVLRIKQPKKNPLHSNDLVLLSGV